MADDDGKQKTAKEIVAEELAKVSATPIEELDAENMARRYPKVKAEKQAAEAAQQVAETALSQVQAQNMELSNKFNKLEEASRKRDLDEVGKTGDWKKLIAGYETTETGLKNQLANERLKNERLQMAIDKGVHQRLIKHVRGDNPAEIMESIMELQELTEEFQQKANSIAPTATATAPVGDGKPSDWVSSAKKRGIPTSI